MSTSHFDVAVLIGRFQPFHNGHAALLTKALQSAPVVVVVIGSAYSARNAKNPFNWEERAAMIGVALDETTRARVRFLPLRDYYDDARWAAAVTAGVADVSQAAPGDRVALIGHLKDASSQYLNRFPDWEFLAADRQGDTDATSLRHIWFEGENDDVTKALLSPLLPAPILQYMQGWQKLSHFARLRAEHLAVEESKKVWGAGPFITVDAVVRAAGHILLVRRGRSPGQGLMALPGGFLDGRERVLQGAIRELREETGFAVLDATLEEALAGVAVFDHPDRSTRGRTITHAHFFDLKHTRLPEVQGADDAAEARWVPQTELAGMEGELFEDHFNILNHFLGLTCQESAGC